MKRTAFLPGCFGISENAFDLSFFSLEALTRSSKVSVAYKPVLFYWTGRVPVVCLFWLAYVTLFCAHVLCVK